MRQYQSKHHRLKYEFRIAKVLSIAPMGEVYIKLGVPKEQSAHKPSIHLKAGKLISHSRMEILH